MENSVVKLVTSEGQNQLAKTTSEQSLKACLDLLDGWKAIYPLPVQVTKPMLSQALDFLAPSVAPASREAIAIAADTLISFARAHSIQVDAKAYTASIAENLSDLPSDLLVVGAKAILRSWKWGNRLPMPGEIREFMGKELQTRLAPVHRLQTAAIYAK